MNARRGEKKKESRGGLSPKGVYNLNEESFI
jgi:hypothetical protein